MKSAKNKIKFALVTTSFLLVSCDQLGVSKEENIMRACIEMKSTTVGFSGPSKRIDIAKEYGIPLDHVDMYNTMISYVTKLASPWDEYLPEKAECFRATPNCQETLLLPQPEKWMREVEVCAG